MGLSLNQWTRCGAEHHAELRNLRRVNLQGPAQPLNREELRATAAGFDQVHRGRRDPSSLGQRAHRKQATDAFLA